MQQIGERRTSTWWIAIGLVTIAAMLAVCVDAACRTARHRAALGVAPHAARVALADLALSSTSRWLRHPSQSERGAPFQDGPSLLDLDPGGAWIAPPAENLREARDVEVVP